MNLVITGEGWGGMHFNIVFCLGDRGLEHSRTVKVFLSCSVQIGNANPIVIYCWSSIISHILKTDSIYISYA